jgi:hypothetical protein
VNKIVVALGITLFGIQARAPAQLAKIEPPAPNPFVGAWLIDQTTVTESNGRTTVNDAPATGVFVFTERHYSIMFVPGPERTPCNFDRDHASAACLSAYDNFSADAGAYEFDETTLTAQNMIAKIPDVMQATADFEWQLDEEALILTLRGAWAPPDGQIKYRLRRLE